MKWHQQVFSQRHTNGLQTRKNMLDIISIREIKKQWWSTVEVVWM